jgi:hypothetical protein
MRLFGWFRRKPPAPSIDDPVFGKLTRHNEELWVGSCVIEGNQALTIGLSYPCVNEWLYPRY